MQNAVICLDAAAYYGQSESHVRFIRPALDKGRKNLFWITRMQTAAVIFHVYQDAIGSCVGIQGDIGSGLGELEGVLQEVPDRRGKQMPVGHYGKVQVHRRNDKPAVMLVCLKRRGDLDINDKRSERKELVVQCHSGLHPNVEYRTIH